MMEDYARKGGSEGTLYYRFDAQTQGFDAKMQGVNKGLGDTAKSAKRAGDEGQKAMSKWEKAMNKAGKSAWDFGTQTFESMTVMDALKEGMTGWLEMAVMGLFSEDPKMRAFWEDYWATVIGGPMGKAIMDVYQAARDVDWGGLGEDIGKALGTNAREHATTTVSTVFEEIEWDNLIARAMERGDWGYVVDLLDRQIASGQYDMIDDAIRTAIGKGDYEAAAKIISANLSGYDYGDIGTKAASDFQGAFTDMLTAQGKGFTDTDEGYLFSENFLSRMLENADWEGFNARLQQHIESGVITAGEAAGYRTQFAYMLNAQNLSEQLKTAADNFADYMMSPNQYTGLGEVLYNAVIADLSGGAR